MRVAAGGPYNIGRDCCYYFKPFIFKVRRFKPTGGLTRPPVLAGALHIFLGFPGDLSDSYGSVRQISLPIYNISVEVAWRFV